GGVRGREVKIQLYDIDLLTPEGTQAAFRKVVDAKPPAVGCAFTLITTPGFEVISNHKAPYLHGETKEEAVNLVKGDPKKYSHIFQVDPPEIYYGKMFPLFLEQLAATLNEQTAALPAALPTTIRGIVTARLDALPAEERSLLVDAAVIGRVFWRGALSSSWDDEALSRLFAALDARDLIQRETTSIIEGQQQYAFKHGMIRDVAYDTLPRKRRQERHAEVAEFLEAASLTGTEAVAAKARHWRDAGRPERAVDYFLTAAEQAGNGWAKDRAALFYGEALECLPDDDPRRRMIRAKQALTAAAAQHVVDAREHMRKQTAAD
ncbi:MAG: hypothetical protein ACTHK4_12300, partial [Mycobacteriales bacterium]